MRLRDEVLNGGIFYAPREAQDLIEVWRRLRDTIRPHSSMRYPLQAPAAIICLQVT